MAQAERPALCSQFAQRGVGRQGDEECDGRCRRQDPAAGLVAVEPRQATAAAAGQ
jgi:hypothetical protein